MSEEIRLSDVRRFAILNRTAVTCRSRGDGRTCVVNRKGTIEIPGIAGRPTFNAEELMAVADEFHLEPETGTSRSVAREELARRLKELAPAAAPAKEE